jgi:general secretion pathway protein E
VLIEVRRFMASRSMSNGSLRKRSTACCPNATPVDGRRRRGRRGSLGSATISISSGQHSTADDLLDQRRRRARHSPDHGIIADAARQACPTSTSCPYETGLVIRMRVDGVLRERCACPRTSRRVVVSRIKVMARLDIAERRVPQDGRIGLDAGGKLIDVRVSTLPSRAGERVVLRILDKDKAGSSSTSSACRRDRGVFRGALEETNGIILVTGPTGSGKTTHALRRAASLERRQRNILTSRIRSRMRSRRRPDAVQSRSGSRLPRLARSCARTTRTWWRIRDRETATSRSRRRSPAISFCPPSHHDAIGAITRMRDMKIESVPARLLAASPVIAQRLVRKLCQVCREPVQASNAVSALLGFDSGTIIYEAKGCSACGNSGFKGRIGVFEAIRIDETVRQLITPAVTRR